MYTVWIDQDRLIDLLQALHDNKIYENITEDDKIESINLNRQGEVEIVIGEEVK